MIQKPNHPKNKLIDRTRKVSKKYTEHKQSNPAQLSLFENLGAAENDETKRDYSRTIELYDFMPKYVWGKQESVRNNNSKMLPILEREFYCRNKKYKLVIHPSAVKDEKTEQYKYFYPGIQEEIVEDVLRKILVETGGLFLDSQVAVKFSIRKIQSELKLIGHSMSHYEITKALHVLKKTNYELIADDEHIIFSPVMTLGLKGKDEETQTFVVFSPLVTESVKNLDFRLYNYRTSMAFKSCITRQLHKRLAHHYTQASIANRYTIHLTTIIRDLGLTLQKSLAINLTDIEKALKEMKSDSARIILDYKLEKVYENRKMVEVVIHMTPTNDFAKEASKANYFSKKVKESLSAVQ